MSKKIKAIKCPQCGSTKQKAIDEEHFQCLNCGTEYIIDSEDININHNYNYNNAPTPPVNTKALGYILGAVIGVPLLIFLITSLFSTADKTIKDVVVSKKYTWENATKSKVFADKNGNLKMFFAGDIDYISGNGRDADVLGKLYWGVYDVASGKMDQINQFPDIQTQGFFSGLDFEMEKFDDGNIYYIVKESKVFVYNTQLNSFTNITADLEKNIPQLRAGIGTIEFENYLHALLITSNTGKKITYFPSTKIHLQDFKVYDEPTTDFKEGTLQTCYIESSSNPGYVIKYEALRKAGYPTYTRPTFNVSFNANDEPIKVSSHNLDHHSFIKSYKILNTENRQYKLQVLDYNQNTVLTAFKNSIQEGEKYHFQLLDGDGNIKWSYKSDFIHVYEESSYLSPKNEAVVDVYRRFLWFDTNGKLKKDLKIEDITFDIKK